MNVLITGGTGSFGQAFTKHLLRQADVERIVIYSRDELKQHQMRTDGLTDPRLRYFIGDVRDRDRLRRAMHNITTVVHAAALKQVDSCEFNPAEAVNTNVHGTANVVDSAIDANVARVLMLGTDKACDPTNLYGATKLVAEKLVVDGNAYSGRDGTAFAATRYGNVISSRGSVLPLFQQQAAAGGILTVTDPTMTRFVLTLDQGVRFVSDCLEVMSGGEVFVPKLPAVTVQTIADSVGYRKLNVVGMRPGEKQHELLVSHNESGRTLDRGWHYLIRPLAFPDLEWDGLPMPAGVAYASDTTEPLTVDEFRTLAGLT